MSHHQVPIEYRERLTVSSVEMGGRLRHLRDLGIQEAVGLSTCNRMEIYGVGTPAVAQTAFDLMVGEERCSHGIPTYRHVGREAVRHAIRVGAGLDSLVVGEAQIFGQLKSAVALAQSAGMVGPVLSRAFPRIFSAVKRIRGNTDIGAGAVSTSSVAVEIAQKMVSRLSECVIGVIGAGKIGRLAVEAFVNAGASSVIIASRSLDKAQALSEAAGPVGRVVEDVQTVVDQADIVICSASSPGLVDAAMMRAAMKLRWHRPVFFIDLGVPRNVDPSLGKWEGVYVYNIDDLRGIASERLARRQDVVAQAERMIEQSLNRWEEARDCSRSPVIHPVLSWMGAKPVPAMS